MYVAWSKQSFERFNHGVKFLLDLARRFPCKKGEIIQTFPVVSRSQPMYVYLKGLQYFVHMHYFEMDAEAEYAVYLLKIKNSILLGHICCDMSSYGKAVSAFPWNKCLRNVA